MPKFLDITGKITIVLGIILGIVYGNSTNYLTGDDSFQWLSAIVYWISSIISGSVLITLGLILDYAEENNAFLRELVAKSRAADQENRTPKKPLGNSKASLAAITDYKFKAND